MTIQLSVVSHVAVHSSKLVALPVICLCMLVLPGCTAQAWYDGAKVGAANECRKQPPGAAEECLARLDKTKYDDYEKERAGKR